MSNADAVIASELHRQLTSGLQPLLYHEWTRVIHGVFADWILKGIDLDSGRISANWREIDDALMRSKYVVINAVLHDQLIDRLKSNGDVVSSIQGLPYKPTRARVEFGLRAVIPNLVAGPLGAGPLTGNPFPDTWPIVADRLGAFTHAAIQNNSISGLRLHNALLLTAYFHNCKLPSAALAEYELGKFGRSESSIRGSLVHIVERISPDGVLDVRPRVSRRAGGLTLRHRSLTALLEQLSVESVATAAGKGFMQRVLAASGAAQPGSLQKASSQRSQDYEHTVLGLGALSAIEQLLRAWARNRGRLSGYERLDGNKLYRLLADLGCSSSLSALFRQIYDKNGANLRNRILHGSQLMLEPALLGSLLPLANPVQYAPILGELSPSNLYQLSLECLEQLDSEIAASVNLVASDLDWSPHFSLSAVDVQFGHDLHCEFQGPARLDFQRKVFTFLKAVSPNVRLLFDVGLLGWIGQNRADRLVLFMALALVFEALYRITVELHDHDVLQVPPDVLEPVRKNLPIELQYRMLDTRQLCHPSIVGDLIAHIDPAQRGVAERVLGLAVRIRDAMAHGAIDKFDLDTDLGMGHILLKAILLLVDAGEHRMTQVAAYFEWQKLGSSHGQHVEHWQAAETNVLQLLAKHRAD